TSVFVTTVHPGGIKTNIVRNGRMITAIGNKKMSLEKQVRMFEKVAKTTPDQAAKVILDGIMSKKRRILIGKDAKFLDRLQRLFPERYTDIFTWLMKKNS
ncbi:MAG: acetoin dehydrogenase, partial [Oleibacter sp.]|nr:acetoin dehydrogenase [Thalassolituus sp.]